MLASKLLPVLLLALRWTVTATPLPDESLLCGTVETPKFENISSHMEWIEDAVASGESGGELNGIEGSNFDPADGSMIEVDVYFHFVSRNKEWAEEAWKRKQKQFDVLYRNFLPANIRLILKNTTSTVNDTWAHKRDEDGMKKALRQGTFSALNIYFLTNLNLGLGGLCAGPVGDIVSSEPRTRYVNDGCLVDLATMPGSSVPHPYDGGKVAIHEVGHWFGLAHTFDGHDCSGPGDNISDTPAEKTEGGNCKPRDSCPGSPGVDPIDNFMEYMVDACKHRFTKGQHRRMRNVFHRYRAGF